MNRSPLRSLAACLLAVLLPLLSARADAGQYLFRHYSTDDGLSGNSILCMTQDDFGVIWAGTRNGVCWFDGERFNPLTTVRDSAGYFSSSIQSLCTSPDGQVWMATARGLCSFHPGTGELRYFEELDTAPRDVHCDRDGRLWFVAGGAACRLDPQGRNLTRYDTQEHFYAYRGCLDGEGQMWYSSRDGQLYRYLPESDSFEPFRILPRQTLARGISPRILCALSDGDFLVATSANEILRVNPARNTAEVLLTPREFEDEAMVMCLMENRKGEYLIGSNKGLYLFDSGTRRITEVGSDPSDQLSLSSDNIRSLFKDRDGKVWIGTFYSGINLWLQSDISFFRNFSANSPASIRGNTVRSICQDEADNIWIGTEDGFLNRIAPDGTILHLGPEHGLPPTANYHSLLCCGGELLIATYDNGIFRFDPVRLRVTGHAEIPGVNFICLLETRDGQVYAGSGTGLYRFEPEDGRLVRLDGAGSYFVHSLLQDSRGRIWIGTYGQGPWLLDPGSGNCQRMSTGAGSPDLDRTHITHLYEDREGTLWMATEGEGLCSAEPGDVPGTFRTQQYTREDGLPSDVTCAIVQSREGPLWISTDKGLFAFDPQARRLTGTYYDKNNTVGNYYRYGSVMTGQDGRFYLGTTLGMLAFRPSSFRSRQEPEILITEILAGREEKTAQVRQPGRSALTTDEITVRQRDAAFLTFRYTNITADDWHPRRYQYRFSGRHASLESVTEENSVTFAGLRPGRYTFEVSAAGTDTDAPGRQVSIRVRAPFYASWAALLFYLLTILSLIAGAIYRRELRRKKEREQQLQLLEDRKQHEIYDAKINFFTNIAHEIRTPLTLIKMPVDKIIEEHLYTPQTRDDLNTVQANTDRLLSLTNQLLDVRKIESKQLQLNFLPEDLCALTRRVCGYFTRAAQENHIAFLQDIPDGEIRIMCAAASIEKVINNLISNGLKYCATSVRVSLAESADGKGAVLRVTSDGDRITGPAREKIFEPFYQERSSQVKIIGSKGTGLGLPFARMLTELHNGRLYLEDAPEPGNSFVLLLPKEQDQPIDLYRPKAEEPAAADTEEADRMEPNRHTVLIAEDDAELNNYLRKVLAADYNILQAFNGDEALETIRKQKVDILVSDIMMPGIDGCTLCNIIKTNLEYSHIPVLLLTAAVGMERHIETLQVGADGYLEKPFPIELLKASIRNLFDNRELTFKQFTNSPLSHFNGLKVGNMDDDYMNRLHREVMKRLSDPDLNIDNLVSAIGTSKSTLFRKVKANTGLNINEYIKLCRLKKAAELLAGQKYKIGEVVYQVGFTSASYFTANFKKQFNVSPSDFIRQVKGERKPEEE